MIELIEGLPANVVGVRGSGQVSADDYQNVLIPSVEEKLGAHGRIRLLYVLGPDVDGFSPGAVWEDAKVGMQHLTSWDRIAVVTDIDWVEDVIKAVGFAMPCQVRVFDDDDLDEAREWISKPLPTSDLSFELLRDRHVLILRPRGELEAGDFERVAAEVDPMIEQTGGLRGLMVVAEEFEGWEDFAAFVSHLRFVKDHHRKIGRVALVTNDSVVAMGPRLLRHFIAAEVRRFPTSAKDKALGWVSEVKGRA